MSKARDETIVIPKDVLAKEMSRQCKNVNFWTEKEVNALKQMFNENGVFIMSHTKATELINRYARDPKLPPRTVGQIRNKIDALRTTGEVPRPPKFRTYGEEDK